MRLLRHGLALDGVQLKPAQVSWQNDDQLRFVLREGRKRQIRRMCELVGLVVTGLKRVRSGRIMLVAAAGGAVALPGSRRALLMAARAVPGQSSMKLPAASTTGAASGSKDTPIGSPPSRTIST
jgi:hypothetical protein